MGSNQRMEIFWDLRRFLKTENVEIEGLTKSEVRNWYSKEYMAYKQQITPDEKLPSFFHIMQTMYKMNLAHFNEDVLVLGPCPQVKKGKSPNQTPQKQRHLKQMKTNEIDEPKNAAKGSAYKSKHKAVQRSSPHGEVQEDVVRYEDGVMTLNGRPVTRRQLMKRQKMKVAVDQHLTFKSGLSKLVDQPDFKGILSHPSETDLKGYDLGSNRAIFIIDYRN